MAKVKVEMKNKEHKFICTSDYINFDGNLCFKKNNTYTFTCKNNVYLTQKNHGGYSHELYLEDIENHFVLASYLENKGENEDSHNVIEKGEIEHKNKLNFQSDLELDFDMEVQSTLQKIQQLLLVKGKEYRRLNNPYHNFEIGSQISGEIPEKVLQGFVLKHLVSYQDMLNDIEQGKLPKIELVEEKMNDIILYYIIQKAQIINRIKKS